MTFFQRNNKTSQINFETSSLHKRFIELVFQNLSVNASIFTLTAIAVDRYFYSIRTLDTGLSKIKSLLTIK